MPEHAWLATTRAQGPKILGGLVVSFGSAKDRARYRFVSISVLDSLASGASGTICTVQC